MKTACQKRSLEAYEHHYGTKVYVKNWAAEVAGQEYIVLHGRLRPRRFYSQ